MKRAKRILFMLLISVMVVITALTLTACGNKNNGNGDDNGDKQDKVLTAEEAESLFKSLKINMNKNVSLIVSSGGDSYNFAVMYSGDKMFMRNDESDWEGDWIVTIAFANGQWNSYVYSTDKRDPENIKEEKTFTPLQDWEYAEYKEEVLSYARVYSGACALEMSEESNALAVAENGSAAARVFSGTEYSGGDGYVTMTQQCISGDTAYSLEISVYYNTDKDVTQLNQTTNSIPEYMPDNYEHNNSRYMNITVDYNAAPFSTDFTGYTQDQTQNVSFEFRNVINNGGLESASAMSGQTATIPAASNGDVKFEGWYYDSDLKYPVEKSGDNYVVKAKYGSSYQGFYAKWESAARPTLNLNGGVLDESDSAEAEVSFILSEYRYITPIKEGKSFEGWYFDPEFNEALTYSNGQKIQKGVNLYAKYVDNVTVTFVADGINYKIAKKIGAPGSWLDMPRAVVRKGYFFEGWYLDAAFTQPVTSNYFPEQNATYYAKFTKGINVNLNVGSNGGQPKYITIPAQGTLDDLMQILRNLQLASGTGDGETTYYFDGWTYADGSEITAYPTGDEVSLRANYTLPVYIYVSYDPSVQPVEYMVQDLKQSYPSYSKFLKDRTEIVNGGYASITVPAGYKVEGWYSDSGLTQKITDNTPFPSSSVTAYAHFVEIKRFKFEFNGGQFSDSYSYVLEQNLLPMTVYDYMTQNEFTPKSVFNTCYIMPIKDGGMPYYMEAFCGPESDTHIEGWYLDPDLTVRFEAYDTVPTEIITLYAKYETNTPMCFVVCDEDGNVLDTTDYSSIPVYDFYSYNDYNEGNKTIADFVATYSYVYKNKTLYIDSEEYYCDGKIYTDNTCTEEYVGGYQFGGAIYLKYGKTPYEND